MMTTAEQVISACDLSYTYAGASEPAISNLSFDVARGEIIGFLGPSAAGTSTT